MIGLEPSPDPWLHRAGVLRRARTGQTTSAPLALIDNLALYKPETAIHNQSQRGRHSC
jgi:hypothetical protein